MSSSRRFLLLISPRGDLTCLPAGDRRLASRYYNWQVALKINRPLTWALANAAKAWAVLAYEL